jgi:hypothetical protein
MNCISCEAPIPGPHVEGCPMSLSTSGANIAPPRNVYHDAQQRYHHDPMFHAACETMVSMALHAGFTPGEMRDIAFTAALLIEQRHARPFMIAPARKT